MSQNAHMFLPASTYRIQFNRNFTFKHLTEILDYLEELGITTIYAAPILKAAANSDHGYNGIDPTCLNPEIGTEEELEQLVTLLRKKGMSWVQDIVPNHLAFDTHTEWLYDVFERGINSSYANHFDIDWDHPVYTKRLMIPFLEDDLPLCIVNNKLTIGFGDTGFYVAYYDNRYPLNADCYSLLLSGALPDEAGHVNAAISAMINNVSTDIDHWQLLKQTLLQELRPFDATIQQHLQHLNTDNQLITQVLAMQHFVLCNHTDSYVNINFRRFFNVNGLICLRVEDEKVFKDYHAYIHTLYEKGLIQGLRIDHLDGLKNPRQYLDRLREYFGEECYIIVEKILDVKEELPTHFNIEGTSGYEFLSYINQVVTDREGAAKLLSYYTQKVPEFADYDSIVFVNKMDNLQSYLNGEWDNLLRYLLTLNLITDEEVRIQNLKMALGTFMAAYPVYRAYIDQLPLEEQDYKNVQTAFEHVKERFPDLRYEYEILQETFEPHEDLIIHNNRLLFIQRLMQFTGPLAAKGVEDCTFYRYNPLISHNEVGDQPCVLGIPVQVFHDKMKDRHRLNPHSMNCTSTHDTKRGEDARIRINVISEMAERWTQKVEEWCRNNESFKTTVGDVKAPIFNDEYFIYQSLIGSFPWNMHVETSYVDRTKAFLQKAFREAKLMTGHIHPNDAYESACFAFVDRLLDPNNAFLSSFKELLADILPFANTYSLVQTIIKSTAPGIPDTYRGCEMWDLSYVDPDNRLPVDFDKRALLLREIRLKKEYGDLALLQWTNENYLDGTQKLFVTQRMLQLRKKYPALFSDGDYIPVTPTGGDRIVIAFLRKNQTDAILVVLPLGVVADAGKSLHIDVPVPESTSWTNIFTNEQTTGNHFDVHELFHKFPVTVLYSALT